MLVSVYLPFSDFRCLMVDGFFRLAKPAWPFPNNPGAHLRSIGAIRRRRKHGFDGWIGEDRLAFGVNALTIQLPRHDDQNGLGRIRLIRKACYFDGLLNGRIELLFSVEPKLANREAAFTAARRFLHLKAKVPKLNFDGDLCDVSRVLGNIWARVSVKHGQEFHEGWVRTGRPICIVESDNFLGKPSQVTEGRSQIIPITELTFLPEPKPNELLLISQFKKRDASGSRGSSFRFYARYVRTYVLRLLQNVEALSLLFSLPLKSIDDDRIQNIFNEYTRQINRSRQRMEHFEAGDLVDYCYSAFARLYPGRIDGLRSQVQGSEIRPNVVKKMLEFLELSEASSIRVTNLNFGDEVRGDKIVGDKVMGDKYEKLDISGQGVAVGRGASANVSHSQNAPTSVASALSSLADTVRKQSGRSDADVEATLVEAAAKKAEDGDDAGAAGILKKSAGWVLDLAKSAGSAVLAAFLKSHLGVG